MRTLTIIFAFIFAATTVFATGNTNKKTDDTAEKKSADKETIYSKTPVMDKSVCKLDLKYDINVNGLTVDFQNKTEGEFTNVEWTFGDGYTTADANGTHTYKKDGEYYFTVTVYNAENGCVDFFADKHIVSSKKVEQEAVVNTKKAVTTEAVATQK